MNMYNKLYTLLDTVLCKGKSPVKNRFYQGFLVFSIFLLLVLQSSCKKETSAPEPEIITPQVEDKKEFGIYLLQDTSKKIYDLLNADIDSLKIQDKAFISKDDIDFYDYSSHCIYLKKSKSELFEYFSDHDPLSNKSVADQPFIIVGAKKNCYIGYFHSFLSSGNYWHFPEITTRDVIYYPLDMLHISWPFSFAEDPRENENVKNALKEYNLFHAGIGIELISMQITRGSKVSLDYGIRITNLDNDNLYVLDPDKTGDSLYNYYNGTPTLVDSNTGKRYTTDNTSIKPSSYLGECNPLWFTRLETGQYIERVVTQTGYAGIPDGVFYCSLSYGGPVYQIEKTARTLSDGRIWIGRAKAELMIISNLKNKKIIAKQNGINSIIGSIVVK